MSWSWKNSALDKTISIQWRWKTPSFWTPFFFSWIMVKLYHDDVIKWKHFPRYWPFVWRIHNGEAGDLRRHRVHYDFIVMMFFRLWWLQQQTRWSVWSLWIKPSGIFCTNKQGTIAFLLLHACVLTIYPPRIRIFQSPCTTLMSDI